MTRMAGLQLVVGRASVAGEVDPFTGALTVGWRVLGVGA